MASDADRPGPARRPRRPVRWLLLLLLLALGGVAMGAGARQLGYEFRKYLAFTTADIDAVMPRPPDRSQAVTRAMVKAEHVYSPGCGLGVAYCTKPKDETVKLPRSVTFEFPTELVRGVDHKNSKSVAIVVPQRLLSDTWVPIDLPLEEDTPQTRKEANENSPAWRRRKEARMRGSHVEITIGNYYSQSYQRWNSERSSPPPPPCSVTRDGTGLVTIRHAPGYDLSEPPTRHLQCQSLKSFNTAFIVQQFDESGALAYEIECGLTIMLCGGRTFFEDWFVGFHPPADPEVTFPDIYKSIIELLERSVVARSYPRPDRSR